jgi:hypothetical protein
MSEETKYNMLSAEKGVPIKAWTKGVPLEDQARVQLLNVAQLPFLFKWGSPPCPMCTGALAPRLAA